MKIKEIKDYDENDTTMFIDKNNSKKLSNFGLKLPETAPTTVISIRLPTRMLNSIRAFSSELDIPYQGVIKLFLQEEINNRQLEKK